MRVVDVGRRMVMGTALLATIGVAGCTVSSTPSPGSSAATSPTAAAVPTPAATHTSTSPGTHAIQNLVVTSTVRHQLTAAWAAYMHFSLSDVAGNVPGSVYYAFDPATDTYWALARFEAFKSAPMNVLVSMQDGGSTGLFTRAGSGTWQVQRGGVPEACFYIRFFPRAVLDAWSILTDISAGVSC